MEHRDRPLTIRQLSPFLEAFLPDAERAWRDGGPPRVDSGPWSERTVEGEELHFEATALRLDRAPLLVITRSDERFRDLAGRNTTLCVVATNAALDRAALGALARAASAALYRRITPVATPFDGDVIFATAPLSGGVDARPAQVEALAVRALETAIERSVRAGAPGDILE